MFIRKKARLSTYEQNNYYIENITLQILVSASSVDFVLSLGVILINYFYSRILYGFGYRATLKDSGTCKILQQYKIMVGMKCIIK